MTKLEAAVEAVNAWVAVGQGQDGFDWQYEQLTQYHDTEAAEALREWWETHPANPTN
jgi:hypothetical protein